MMMKRKLNTNEEKEEEGKREEGEGGWEVE